jgi:hypothetical protein
MKTPSTYYGLQLVRSDTGDGGWSLHLPEEYEDEDGFSPILLSDTAIWNDVAEWWDRPTQADYERALAAWDAAAVVGSLPKREG